MSMLFIQKTTKINSRKTQELLEKSFLMAAQHTGSMRGVFQGDMKVAVATLKLGKAA